jgi:beta-N-acetylhexosaminidase
MIKFIATVVSVFCFFVCVAQQTLQNKWADSVYKSLTPEQRIAQLMVVRLSSGDAAKTKSIFYTKEVEAAIRKYNIGGICLFQGGPVKQANIINHFQKIARTPIMICIDGETGLGMRFDSVAPLPKQMMLGAIQNADIIYQYGRAVGEQCKRAGIHVNYAPVVDINNNPENPVINDRSFGEDKYKVAQYGIQYMRGMQELGVMACAKHFPGHGDVAVDSHLDLPVINKTKEQLDSLELFPFREIIKAGVGSAMVAHLYIPAIDNTANRATSISYKNVTTLLREELGFNGITFTDALEMKGVAKYFPDGEASAQSIIAGNDMLCLPGDIPGAITKIKTAIKKGKIKWTDIEMHVMKVLRAKYQYGMWQPQIINTVNLTEDLNKEVPALWQYVSQNAITLLKNEEPAFFPLPANSNKKVAYVGIGITKDNEFAKRIRADYDAHVYYLNYKDDEAAAALLLQLLKGRYDVVVAGLHAYNRYPANNFGISTVATNFLQQLQQQQKTVTLAFGNPYAIKNFADAKVLIACYDDNGITQDVAADLMNGKFSAKGKLPVTVSDALPYGTGIIAKRILPEVTAAALGFNTDSLEKIDAIVNQAMKEKAIPGAVVLVAKDGKVAYEKAYGYLTYYNSNPVYPQTIYDLASVTKIMATTLSVMKLYDEGRLDLNKKLSDYLPCTKGSNKENLLITDVLLHQAGLKSFIPFYREVSDSLRGGIASGVFFANRADSGFTTRIANNLYMRNDWVDTMYRRILQSEVTPPGKYVYSDNDFIFLGKIVEQISGMPLQQYVKKTFYDTLQLETIGFLPRQRFDLNRIAPTEEEKIFRAQLIQGDVHDPGAAMFGGVAGHAGLFSNAYDIAVLAQMLLNGGTINGVQFFKKSTVDLFTAYQSSISRRGYGFDKPEKDNETRKDPYPSLSTPPQTFGHTGFTGTCVWMDPVNNLIFIMLTNRVHPTGSNKFLQMNVRPNVQETIYRALKK